MIEFKNPPAGRTNKGPRQETQDIIAALQSRPGEWALIKEDTSAAITTQWKKREGIEAKSSTIGKLAGKVDIYARWVGTK